MKHLLLLIFICASSSLFAQYGTKTPGCLDSLKIPITFTPNGDSFDDAFEIYFPCAPEKFEIKIFNRWGNAIFTSKEYTFRWAGTDSSGSYASEGVYFYMLTFTYLDEEKTLQGNVHLML